MWRFLALTLLLVGFVGCATTPKPVSSSTEFLFDDAPTFFKTPDNKSKDDPSAFFR